MLLLLSAACGTSPEVADTTVDTVDIEGGTADSVAAETIGIEGESADRGQVAAVLAVEDDANATEAADANDPAGALITAGSTTTDPTTTETNSTTDSRPTTTAESTTTEQTATETNSATDSRPTTTAGSTTTDPTATDPTTTEQTAPTGNVRPDLVFGWTAGAKPTGGSRLGEFAGSDYWIQGINCGSPFRQEHYESTRVAFGVDTYQRFPGERSVEFFSDRSLPAACDDHKVSHRAEMSLNNNRSVNNQFSEFRHGPEGLLKNSPSLGIEVGTTSTPGSVLWLGWSERYEDIALESTTTLFQLRSNCGTGSPAVSLVYRHDDPYSKGNGIFLITSSGNGAKRDNYTFIAPLTANVWRDFAMEVGYSYRDTTGFVKIWHASAQGNSPASFDYDNPSIQVKAATLYGADAPFPSNANDVDECPHLRWGLYRHGGSTVEPDQIPGAERKMTKYHGTVRLLVGRDLRQDGLDAVTPRPLS